MRLTLVLALAVAGCGTAYAVPEVSSAPPVASAPVAPAGRARTEADFARVVGRVKPAAERFCRQEQPQAPAEWCDFRIALLTDPRVPPNAFQTEGADGRPQISFAASLLPIMDSDDEIAFVLSHEASHHIAGHIPKQQQQQAIGAMVFGGLMAAAGNVYGMPASDQAIRQAMDLGAAVGARTYGQTYELEADTLGSYIAARAGYNPQRGAELFARPELASAGGPPLLTSHPGSAQRQATVARVWADIQRQEAAGLEPTPAPAG